MKMTITMTISGKEQNDSRRDNERLKRAISMFAMTRQRHAETYRKNVAGEYYI